MNKNKKVLRKIIIIIETILFGLYMIGLIKLIPSLLTIKFFGPLSLATSIIYILNEVFIFIIKDKKYTKNIVQIIMRIIIYLYVIIIAYKYISVNNDPLYYIEDTYFKINYIVLSITTLGALISTPGIISKKDIT